MSTEELAARLRETYYEAMASKTGVTVAICMFGIRYRQDILNSRIGIHRLCRMADVPVLAPTINLGMNLSKYVAIRNRP